jgi:hypothetical protein
MDRHYVEGATRSAVAHAHQLDLAVQEKYKVQFLTYWFDEPRCTAFCLIVSPDKETVQKAHNEAHGLVPNEIIEVNPSIVQAFLGRVSDPPPVDTFTRKAEGLLIDAAFRAIMFTDLKDSIRMTTTFGDTKALHLLHIHNALTRNALRDHRGVRSNIRAMALWRLLIPSGCRRVRHYYSEGVRGSQPSRT